MAAPAGGLGGSGKILLERKGFAQGVLVQGAQGAAWVRGAAVRGWGSQGSGVLHAQGMLWGTVGLAPGGQPDPRTLAGLRGGWPWWPVQGHGRHRREWKEQEEMDL